jgi:hypothetical protein
VSCCEGNAPPPLCEDGEDGGAKCGARARCADGIFRFARDCFALLVTRECGAGPQAVAVSHKGRLQVRREDEGGWCLVHYSDADSNQPHTITYLGSGTGGVKEFVPHLQVWICTC